MNLKQAKARAKAEGWLEWVKTELDERAICAGYKFDPEIAKLSVEFFHDILRHSKDPFAGQPFALQDWQKTDVIGPLYGWRRPDGTRRYRRAYIEVPKKNGKSTLCSGLAIRALLEGSGSEVYAAAASRDQAKIVFNEAANMVGASKELEGVLTVRRSQNTIFWRDKQSVFRAIASDADTAQGKNASCVICDELHVWRSRDFFESLIYSGRARAEPLFVIITTAGDDLSGLCWEEHLYAQQVIKGEVEDLHHLALIYGAEDGDDWRSPETWRKANPSLGVTIAEETLAEDCQRAQESPTRENVFRRYSLNQWVGATAGFISLDEWMAEECRQPIDEQALLGRPCYGGIDLSRNRDLSAVVWCFQVGPLYYFLPRVYIPSAQISRREREDHVPYRSWIRDGFIRECQGEVTDYEQIRSDVIADSKLFDVREIGYDPYNAEHLCEQQLGLLDGLNVVAHPQSMQKMCQPTQELQKIVKAGTIRHGAHPVIDWMVSGAAAYEDTNGNIRPIKKHSTTRIDGVVAAIIALGRCMGDERPPSVYTQRRAFVFSEGKQV